MHAAGKEDVDDAVKAARAAFNGPWVETGGTARGALMYRLVELIEQSRKTLATIEAWDSGTLAVRAFQFDCPGAQLTEVSSRRKTVLGGLRW